MSERLATAPIAITTPEQPLTNSDADLGDVLPPPPSANPRVPGFEILGELGRGGMGVVYKATQIGLNRLVALKMILHGDFAGDEPKLRFRLEAEAVARLRHPNIVQIYEVGEHQGQPFFALEFCDGGSLRSALKGGPLAPRAAAKMVESLARAVDMAHQSLIVHRDLKPDNVLLLADGTPKVTDFGLARKLEGETALTQPGRLTQSGAVMGTPHYMPPEQARGQRVGPPADIYSLGAILYELLTGRPPFDGKTLGELFSKVLLQEPARPSSKLTPVPRDLEIICLKCLQKEPAARYASAEALADDLRRYLAGEPIVARPVGWLERTFKWARRYPARAAAALTVVVLATVGVSVAIASLWQDAEQSRAIADTQRGIAENARTRAEIAQREETSLKNNLAQQLEINENTNKELAKTNLELQDAKEKLARNGALDLVSFAWQQWEAGNRLSSLDLLTSCEEKHRGLEWHLLQNKSMFLHTLTGHKDPVLQLLYSPTGDRLVSVGSDKTARLWDPRSGKLLGTITEIRDSRTPVKFSPDGRYLVITTNGNVLKLWDTRDGKTITTVATLKGMSAAIDFSPDGRLLATGHDDKSVKLWEVASGKEVATFSGHSDWVTRVLFSPDGKQLACLTRDEVVLWTVASGKKRNTLPNHQMLELCFSPDNFRLALGDGSGKITLWDISQDKVLVTLSGHRYLRHLAFSPDGNRLASTGIDSGSKIKLWDVRSGREVAALANQKEEINGICFSPDGERLASASANNVQLWDVGTGKLLTTLNGHFGGVSHVCFSPDGKQLATAGTDGIVKLWNMMGAGEQAILTGHQEEVGQALFSPDGQCLASCGKGDSVMLWDAVTGKQLFTLEPNLHPRDLKKEQAQNKSPNGFVPPKPPSITFVKRIAFSADGRMLASGCFDNSVKVWDVASGKLQTVLKGHKDYVVDACFSPDGKLLASASEDTTAKIWDLQSGQAIATLPTGKLGAAKVCFSPDGRLLATGGWDGKGKLWDTATGNLIATLPGSGKGGALQIVFSPDGQRLAACSEDKIITLWDVATGKLLASLSGHYERIRTLAFSPDGQKLASGSWDATVKIWDVASGELTANLVGHRDKVNCLSFSPDGQRLVSAADDGTARIWHVVTAKELAVLADHQAPVRYALFSPDGQRLASAGDDGNVRLWFGNLDETASQKRLTFMLEKEAKVAVQSRHWFAAAFHLRQLLKLRPNERELQFHLDQVLAELEKEQNGQRK